ncbi:MAG: phytanoyl-CoA dioxygenase family protein [Lentisphaeria bacterium]|nr:phytanoyl-CoA dioxygenase family protein [Lentisphaeria bacterium]
MPTDIKNALDAPYELEQDQIDLYQKNGFIKLKNVLSQEMIDAFEPAITSVVRDKGQKTELEERDTYGKAFHQVSNIWETCETVKEFVFSKRVAKIAANLMGCSGVRMYHDQALYKEPGGGFTPWHADQQYWPLTTQNCVTAWMPLQAVPSNMAPLEFAIGSHQADLGRNLEISDDSEKEIRKNVFDGNYDVESGPFELGEISFHAGWCFHRAAGNDTDGERKVMTIIYIDENMLLKKPENGNQQNDWGTWLPGVEIGAVCDSPKNPVLWSSNA